MRIEQRCHFDVRSEQMTAEEVTARLGMDPDHVLVRGSRMADPPRPALHSWSVDCDEPGLCVDEQIQRVVARLEPIADAIGALVEELIAGESGFAILQVARFFDYPDGEEDTGYYGVEVGSGQHQLLSWQLDRRVLDFLDRTHSAWIHRWDERLRFAYPRKVPFQQERWRFSTPPSFHPKGHSLGDSLPEPRRGPCDLR